MLNLIPDWAHHYGEFWRAIRVRNFWFIKLRYFAVTLLIGFLLAGEFIFNFNFDQIQINFIISISLIILLYNIVFHITRMKIGCDPNSFNCLHTSLIMIIVDLIFLTILVYITGTLNSPLYILFVFHMIIGSLILPGYIIYFIAIFFCLIISVITFCEHLSLIPHFIIKGLLTDFHEQNGNYIIIKLIIFLFVLLSIIYLVNRIAKQLYQREQQLRASLERLNDAETAKQRYIVSVVHEIKSPITAVHSIIDILLDKYIGPIDQRVEDKLIRAKTRNDEALGLINDVLKFSKIKLLEVHLSDRINLDELFLKIIDQHAEEVNEKKVTMDFKDKRKSNIIFFGDKVLLEMAFSNIISNSVKYINTNGSIFIILYDSEKYFEIEVSDDGIGIPEKDLSNIFEHFYRGSNIDRKRKEGTGMGLSIVKEIVDIHSGLIEILSPSKIGTLENPGTTVLIRLPKKNLKTEFDNITCEEYL